MLLMSFISTHIVKWQSDYYNTIGSRRLGARWAANFIKQLWKILGSTWHNRNQEIFEAAADPTGYHAELLRLAITDEISCHVITHLTLLTLFAFCYRNQFISNNSGTE